MLQISKTIENGTALIQLDGRLDMISAPQLDAEIKASIDGVQELILDFAELTYISSAGLRVIMTAYEEMEKRGQMKLIHVSGVVMEVLEITRITDIISIE